MSNSVLVVIGIAIMIVGVIGMIICVKKQRVNPALQPLSFVLFVVVLVGGFLCLRGQGLLGGSRNSGAINSEIAYQEARGRKVGEFMRGIEAGRKLVIIADPNYVKADDDKKDRFTKALIDSLVEAYKKDKKDNVDYVVVSVKIPENAEEEGTPLSDYMTPKALDALIPADAGIVVFMNCMPDNPQNMKMFKSKNGPKAMLIGRGSASGKFISDKIKSGEILGVVVGRPKIKYSTPAASNYQKAFDFRYVLIDKDNLGSNADFLN